MNIKTKKFFLICSRRIVRFGLFLGMAVVGVNAVSAQHISSGGTFADASANKLKKNVRKDTIRLRRKLIKLSDSSQLAALAVLPDSTLINRFSGLKKKEILRKLKQIDSYRSTSPRLPSADTLSQVRRQRAHSFFADVSSFNLRSTSAEKVNSDKLKSEGAGNIRSADRFSEKIKPDSQLVQQAEAVKFTTPDVLKALDGKSKDQTTADLILTNELRYRPSPISGLPVVAATSPLPRFVNTITLNGNVTAFGAPVHVDISNSSFPAAGVPGTGLPLFKMGFDPELYQSMMKNEMQRYADLRKNVLNGMDIGSFTSKLLTRELTEQKNKLSGSIALSRYLDNPAVGGRLLQMNEAQATEEIFARLKKEAATNTAEVRGIANVSQLTDLKQFKPQALADLKSRGQELNQLSVNGALSDFVNDPYHRKAFYALTEERLTDTLLAVAQLDRNGSNAIRQMAHFIASKGRQTDYQFIDVIHWQVDQTRADSLLIANSNDEQIDSLIASAFDPKDIRELQSLHARAASAAAALQLFKQRLHDGGFEVNQLLEMQDIIAGGTFGKNLTEPQNRYFSKVPSGFAQQAFAVFSQLKAGSFASSLPGSTRREDLFISGANATLKSANVPLTFGFGAQNDLKAQKDDQFQNTVFNAPRNIGFLGAEIKSRAGGKVKLSFVGSFNQQGSNSLYNQPILSSNTIAFTISKYIAMGKLGNATIDISKSTTLYPNSLISGNEAILDRRGGVGADPFLQSLSFGIRHHLDLVKAGMSNEVYFNYAGSGYQNPGNNGFGGGETRWGGKIKKTVNGNRMIFELRSDMRNRPISFINDDKWQTLQLQFTARYKVSKSISTDLQYSSNTTSKKIGSVTSSAYGMEKIQVNGTANYKIGKHFSMSHLIVGAQRLANGYLAQSGGRLIMFNYNQMLVVKEQAFSLNMLFNKELSDYHLLGDLLNTDVSYQFNAVRQLRLLTGLTYLKNTGLAHQIGVKEGVQWTAGDFNISSTVDIRKNLITPKYTDLYSAIQADLTVSYHFTH